MNRWMRQIGGLTLLAILWALVGCESSPEVARQQKLSQYSTRPYAQVLRASVRNGLVNYKAAARREPALKQYLDAVARLGPESTPARFQPPRQKLAYYLNAYNAIMIYRWLDADAAQAGPGKNVNVLWFITDHWTVDGRSMTLDHLEQQIIRPRFKESRVHFALVCGAWSCPPLLGEPFKGSRLDEQLDALARRFVQEPDGLAIKDNTVYVSDLFNWYKDDFKRLGGVVGVVRQYLPDSDPRKPRVLKALRAGDYKYESYDWSINTVEAAGSGMYSRG